MASVAGFSWAAKPIWRRGIGHILFEWHSGWKPDTTSRVGGLSLSLHPQFQLRVSHLNTFFVLNRLPVEFPERGNGTTRFFGIDFIWFQEKEPNHGVDEKWSDRRSVHSFIAEGFWRGQRPISGRVPCVLIGSNQTKGTVCRFLFSSIPDHPTTRSWSAD